MKAKFIVTIQGDWLQDGKRATVSMAEKSLRQAVQGEFRFLATAMTVKRQAAGDATTPPAALPDPVQSDIPAAGQMKHEDIFSIIRGFGYCTSGQASEIASAIISSAKPLIDVIEKDD